MRRRFPPRYRLYIKEGAVQDLTDPLLKHKTSPAIRALCKHAARNAPVLTECTECQSPVKRQVMYKRGWAAAVCYIVSMNIHVRGHS